VYTASAAAPEELAATLTAFGEEKLARHKVPRYLLFTTEDFPRTPSMRVSKNKLPRGQVPAGVWDREA
ncbi:MAG TPA: hypothetical protein VN817_10700, partial [Solirubrobacteraceae bacterium]|nr:hypothetical protein [Solirubrobacteraceae bacterium]